MVSDTLLKLDAAGVIADLALTAPASDAAGLRSKLEDPARRQATLDDLAARQSDLLKAALAADDIGWASRAGAADAALVEAGSGQRIEAFDGRVINRDRPVGYPDVALPWAEFLPLLADLEGYFPYMYLDIKNFVTVAIGQMMPNAEAAVALNQGQLPFFVKSDRARASDDAVRAEYVKIAALTDLSSRGAGAYKSVTTLTVEKADAEVLLKAQAEDHLQEALATGKYPGFGTYPAGVQMVITDMAFNLGVPKFIAQYVNFRAGILNRDWARAKAESGRRDLGRRNTIVAAWFDDAIAAQRFYLLHKPKGAATTPEKILTMDGGLKAV